MICSDYRIKMRITQKFFNVLSIKIRISFYFKKDKRTSAHLINSSYYHLYTYAYI